jgi:hypothetical protein
MSFAYNMTPEEFIKRVRGLYQEAKLPRYYHPEIHRGRSHSIASITEDLVAAFIAFNLTKKYTIYIDQPITIHAINKTVYPDIAICQDGEIMNIIDVKMDLGWIRNGLESICKENNMFLKSIRNKDGNIKDGINKIRKSVIISRNLKYYMLIVSGCNITIRNLEEQIEKAKKYEPDVLCYVLSGGEHPNAYNITDDEFMERVVIYNKNFDKFFYDINLIGNNA